MFPAYPAAQEVVRSIHPHYARHLAADRPHRLGDRAHLLQHERAHLGDDRRDDAPEQSVNPLLFGRALPLVPEALTRVAPAVERAGIHLGVWSKAEELSVWGTTRSLPPYCFVLEVVAPAVLVLKHSPGEDSGKFGNVAVIEGDKIKILAQHSGTPHHYPDQLNALLEIGSTAEPNSAANVFPEFAVSMRAHGRGGALMIVPDNSTDWRDSIHSISYPVEPPFVELTELMSSSSSERNRSRWKRRFQRTVDAVAGLTAVDGATVITHNYRLLGFGAKIKRRADFQPVEKVLLTEPIENTEAEIIDAAQLGGTRHLSAAQFAHDQRDACALVASQDGRFTLFAWSEPDRMVRAHRVETLLM